MMLSVYKTVMRTRRVHNRRWAAWLLMLALVVMALPSRAAWLCVNGTLCPANCPMLRDAISSTPHRGTPVSARCSNCLPALPTRSVVLRAPQTSCASSNCILQAETHPAATLAGDAVIFLPLLALPPPTQPHFAHIEEPSAVSIPDPVFTLPPASARPRPGRAPPSRLS